MVTAPGGSGAAAPPPPPPPLPHGPALQLLLRFLPFRGGRGGPRAADGDNSAAAQHNRHRLLDELHANPLWRFSRLGVEQRPGALQGALQGALLPQEAQAALLAYVNMAAEAEQALGGRRPARRRDAPHPPSAAEAAEELRAVYQLVAAAAAGQQQQQQQRRGLPGGARGWAPGDPLSDGEVLRLLRAYCSLEGPPGAAAGRGGGGRQQHGQQHDGAQAAAAAVQALYAFAQLAESSRQAAQQQQQPGQLLPAGPWAAGDGKQQAAGGKAGGCHRMGGEQQDLQVLLQLAQLGARA